jgi:DNA-binding beta-propeller fold protein YncE
MLEYGWRYKMILRLLITSALVLILILCACSKNPIQEQVEITNKQACWVSNSNQMSLWDLNGNLLLTYDNLDFTSDIAVHFETRSLWTARPIAGEVVKYSATGEYLLSVKGFKNPVSLAVDQKKHEVWVADKDLGEVVVLGESGQEIYRFSGFSSPTSIACGYSDENPIAWVADPASNTVAIINNYAEPVRYSFNSITVVATDPYDGAGWIFSSGDNKITKINMDGSVRFQLSGFNGVRSMTINPVDVSLWVANTESNELVKIDTAGTEAFRKTDVLLPYDVAIDPQDGSCWTCSFTNNKLYRFGIDGGLQLEIPDVMAAPRELAAVPDISESFDGE